jgi:hypothetical protein
MAIPCEMGTKKGKGTPYQSEALLPVIFSTIIVLAIYPRRQNLPYIKPSNYCLVFILYPAEPFSVARTPLALPLVE